MRLRNLWNSTHISTSFSGCRPQLHRQLRRCDGGELLEGAGARARVRGEHAQGLGGGMAADARGERVVARAQAAVLSQESLPGEGSQIEF